ncbi:myeloperoxidase-like [Pecten maximus]|uniref:myeloperoxidase-like n=1 Tax=Pecten maximus TaxID=6579 RepID=UPI0014583085|nr:myeloperoxidase-like [Pecten maximus]
MMLQAKAFGLVICLLAVSNVMMKSTSEIYRELEEVLETLEEEKREEEAANEINGNVLTRMNNANYTLAVQAIQEAKVLLEKEYAEIRNPHFLAGDDKKSGSASASTMEGLNDLTYGSHGEQEENKTLIALFAAEILINKHNFKDIEELASDGGVRKAFREEEGNCKGKNKILDLNCTLVENSPYRTINGTCNNLDNPLWGSKDAVQIRVLSADYDDGIGSPRQTSVDGGDLPSARTVTRTVLVFDTSGNPSNSTPEDQFRTMMMTVWGQFLDHDITETPMTKGRNNTNVACCQLPKAQRDERTTQCVPITIEPGDVRLTGTCMDVIRSLPTREKPCIPGVREQINGITSFIDASQVYGSDEEVAHELRTFSNGLLKVAGPNLLPKNKDPSACLLKNTNTHCMFAGDIRVNENPHLGAIHVAFVRFHNTLATRMKTANNALDDEAIYQRCRKLIGAIMQHVTYTKWLPAVLGEKLMRKHDLELTDEDDYNVKINPSTMNQFSSASMRYGHTLVNELIALWNTSFHAESEERLDQNFFIVDKLFNESALRDMSRWMVSSPCKKSDAFFADPIFNHLFNNELDLAAVNIQRGREHGLPGYMAFRKKCNLPTVDKFSDLHDIEPDFRNKFANVYKNVEDIDLFAGAIAENPVSDGHVGPTFGCLMGMQFRTLKRGDRYWFDRTGDIEGLTEDQVDAVKNFPLAKLFCDTFGLNRIQEDIFSIPRVNEFKACADFEEFDIAPFLVT